MNYDQAWLSVPTSPILRKVAQELQTPTVISDVLALVGTVSKSAAAPPGQVILKGARLPSSTTMSFNNNPLNAGSSSGVTTTLAISTKAPFYPISLSYSDPQNGSTQWTFSNWGRPVTLTVPAHPVSLDSLQLGGTVSPPPQQPDDSSLPAPVITDTSTDPGGVVTPTEASAVGTQLWEAWVQARVTRDITALRTLDAQPELSADWGYICQYGCRGPELSLSSMSVIVPRQTVWPAYFLATATFTVNCDATASPCDNTFVATQSAPHAPWKIAAMSNWSGHSYATTPAVAHGQFSPAASAPTAAHVNALPQDYAAYLEAIKKTDQGPPDTRLAPGPYTSGLISTNYMPAAAQQAAGYSNAVTYYVVPADPVWQFAGSNGATAVCGTVRYTDVTKGTTRPLVQADNDHPYGNLANGTYSSITLTGLHTVCFESYADPTKPTVVLGVWGDGVTASGTPIHALLNPT